MNNRFCFHIWILLVIFLGKTVVAREQWLQYHYSRDDQSRSMQLQITTKAPPDVDLPEFSAEPLFAKWSTPMCKQRFLWIALDCTAIDLGPYDRLYIDSNGDGSLADEIPINTIRKNSERAHFKPAELVFEAEDGPITYHLGLQYCSSSLQPHHLACWAAGWYEGKVMIKGKPYFCRLVDFNANGAFDDRSDTADQADRILLGENEQTSALIVGKYVSLKDGLYILKIARDGAFVEFNPAQGVMYGQVNLLDPITSVSVFGHNGHFIHQPENGVVRLPVGNYRIKSWSIERKHTDDSLWCLHGEDPLGENSTFAVSADIPTSLRIGEPIVSSLTVDQRSRNGHSFNSHLHGYSGERITLTRNGQRPAAPMLHIVNKAGTYKCNYQFEYG